MKGDCYIFAGLMPGALLWPVVPAMAFQSPPTAVPPPAAGAPAPAAAAPMTDIHDILAPVPVGFYAPWLIPALLILATALLLVAGWWYWKKHKKTRGIETIIPELPPEMTALRALDEISDVRRLDGKTFYFHLSAILRQYAFARFAVGAPEMTTEEFLPCIEGLPVHKDLAQRLRRLCRAMDPIKFGGQTVTEKKMETDLFFAREFVKKTTPPAAAEGDTQGGRPAAALPQAAS
jgi:hypothetical protein